MKETIYKRIFVIVLDSLGIGAMPDSEKFGDRDVDTFGHILDRMGTLEIPNLQKLGMLNLHTGGKMYGIENPVGKITRLKEASNGKDTMTGHWEMMGIYTQKPFITFTETGFPKELIDELEDQMELILLYHYLPSTSTDFGQKCCAYSNPRFGRMYKLNATANGNIECDTLYVTLYDSLEIMGCELREELLKVIKNGHMLFARSEEELLRDFI